MARLPMRVCDPGSCRLGLTMKFPKSVTPYGALEAHGGCEEVPGGAAFALGG